MEDMQFGMARIREEGAPLHPEDMDWEHYPSDDCEKCTARWNAQLKAYNDYQGSKLSARDARKLATGLLAPGYDANGPEAWD
jgi:hypothetical protein